MANPPFAGEIKQSDMLAPYELAHKKDGKLDKAELEEIAKQFAERFRGGRGRGEGGDRGEGGRRPEGEAGDRPARPEA